MMILDRLSEARFLVTAAIVFHLISPVIAAPGVATTAPLGQPRVAPASDEGELAMKRFRVAPGLKVSLFAAEPDLANPVAFCVDDQGRFYVAETYRHSAVGPAYRFYEGVFDIRSHMDWLEDDLASRTVRDRVQLLKQHLGPNVQKLTRESEVVRMIEDTNGDGRADRSTTFAEGFNQIPDGIGAGVLAWHGRVYYTCIPDLWLLQDTDGDGQADRRASLHTGFGVHIAFLGHDLHGLRMGPDGRLYFSVGDRGLNVRTKEGRTLQYPDEGTVLRCNPDGTELEVIARGLRNPQELAFDDYGNLFTGDNNSDGGDRARWVYLVDGSDSGWRIGYQHLQEPPRRGPWNGERLWYPTWDGQAAYIVPPIANLGYGPSGVAHYPGTGLSSSYHDHFFLCDFRGGGSSGIHCFALKPKGAGFELTDYSEFIWDTLPTDVDFGPDGGVYFTDWVDSWNKTGKGRIYRVYDPEQKTNAVVLETKKLLAEGFARREPAQLASLLSHPDQRVRQEAQFALVDQNQADVLQKVAKQSANLLARLHALWGLGQLARQEDEIVPRLIPFLRDPEPEVRAQAAKMVGDAARKKEAKNLVALLEDEHPRVRLHAALALGRLREESAVSGLLAVLRRNDNQDPVLRHGAVMGLTGCAGTKELALVAGHSSAAERMGALLALRRRKRAEVSLFLHDQDPRIILEAARAIYDVPIPDALPELAALSDRSDLARMFPAATNAAAARATSNTESALSEVRTEIEATPLQDQLMQRIVAAHYNLRKSDNAAALSKLAADGQLSVPVRSLALAALANWAKPPGTDLILGAWRPLPKRNSKPAAKLLEPKLKEILQSTSASLQLAAITAAQQLKMFGSAEALAELSRNQAMSGEVRARALRSLLLLAPDKLAPALDAVAADTDETVRKEASRLRVSIDPTAGMRELVMALDHGTVIEKQSALATLAALEAAGVDDILLRWMQQLRENKVPKELQLDVLSAASQRSDPSILQLVKEVDLEQRKTQLGSFEPAYFGGNAEAGKKIFNERPELSCLRCHKINGEGGEVGPDLSRVGATHSRSQLVESILFPNNQIAAGYDTVLVTLQNETTYAGKVKNETADELVIDSPEDGQIRVSKKDIKLRTRGLSAMPEEFRQILSKSDLRDLVEYLSSLR